MIKKFVTTILILLTLSVSGQTEEKDKRPNILLIVADDLGFSDLGCYGSEIPTPYIDSLANKGILFKRFYASPASSPSRAMLMSGVDNHLSGLGTIQHTHAANQKGQPGYESYLNNSVVCVADLFKQNGYHTYMTGKWHLGEKVPYFPYNHGFERSFAFSNDNTSHFEDIYSKFGQRKTIYFKDSVHLKQLPEGFYSTRFFTDELIDYIEMDLEDGKPFFAWLAYSAPHTPIQAPDDIIDNFLGRYDAGYEYFRAKRFQKQKNLGLFDVNMPLPPIDPSVRKWEELDDDLRRRLTRTMEIYATMIAEMDRNVGKIINYLKENDLYDNTLIIFISDNGPEPFSEIAGLKFLYKKLEKKYDNTLENIGRRTSYAAVGEGWANVSATPLRLWKGSTAEGGIRVPCLIHYPKKIKMPLISNQITTITDLVPTFLELSNISYPKTNKEGKPLHQLSGQSLLPMIKGLESEPRDFVAFELWGWRAVFQGKWKLLGTTDGLVIDEHQWELFNLAEDPFEQNDLIKKYPKTKAKMIQYWETYKAKNNVVIAIPGVPIVMLSNGGLNPLNSIFTAQAFHGKTKGTLMFVVGILLFLVLCFLLWKGIRFVIRIL